MKFVGVFCGAQDNMWASWDFVKFRICLRLVQRIPRSPTPSQGSWLVLRRPMWNAEAL